MINEFKISSAGVNYSCLIILLVAITLILIPYGLLTISTPIGRDSGVFMYTGMVINSGGVPYIDSWDHKGPLLYLFNALGFRLFDKPSGIVFLEGALLFIALLISMNLWRKFLSLCWIVIVSTLFASTYYATFEGGNLTESWFVPFSLVSYSFAFVYSQEKMDKKKQFYGNVLSVSIGISLAVALLTRPNNGFGLLILAVWLLAFIVKDRLKTLLLISMSFFFIVLPVLFWLNQKGATYDFIDQYWFYNVSYAREADLFGRIKSFYALSQGITFSSLGLLFLLVCGFFLISDNRQGGDNFDNSFVWLMLFIFVSEMASQALSGNSYLHYVTLALSSLSLLLVALLARFDLNGPRLLYIVFALVLLPFFLFSISQSTKILLSLTKTGIQVTGSPKNELIDYIQKNTCQTDLVLIYGAESWLLVGSDRRSPTSMTYYYPAIKKYNNSHQKYSKEIINGKPKIIVESPESCGLSRKDCSFDSNLFYDLNIFLNSEYSYMTAIHGYKFWKRN